VENLKTLFRKESHHEFQKVLQSSLPGDLIWQLEDRIIASVLNNATVQSMYDTHLDKRLDCGLDDNRNSDFNPILYVDLVGKSDYAHFVNHRYSLTFVSCGRPETRNLAYNELISIFDSQIWIYLAVFTLAISLLSSNGTWKQEREWVGGEHHTVTEIGSYTKYFHEYCIPSFLSYFKVLVEQRDPITVSLLKIPFLRFIYLISLTLP